MNIEMTCQELKLKLDHQSDLYLLDVREKVERKTDYLKGSYFVPMHQIPYALEMLPKDKKIVIYCQHGIRSLKVAYYLLENGFDADLIQSLKGGIECWRQEVDPMIVQDESLL